jgi:hypothetical protein
VLPEDMNEAASSEAADGEGPSTSGAPAPHGTAASLSPEAQCVASVDLAYYDSYSYFDIHREMLEDSHRTEAYRHAYPAASGVMRQDDAAQSRIMLVIEDSCSSVGICS